jgi:hypothetical protein
MIGVLPAASRSRLARAIVTLFRLAEKGHRHLHPRLGFTGL